VAYDVAVLHRKKLLLKRPAAEGLHVDLALARLAKKPSPSFSSSVT
jgi:hypothetical protein